MIGRTLSHYQIIEWIADGGMGSVYRAHDLRLKRDVALKVLPTSSVADESSRRQFRREALTLSQLNHPNIGTIFDFDSHDGIDFIVMEFIRGGSLEDKVRSAPMSEREVIDVAIQVASALDAAHRSGVVHRDLKPANIGIAEEGHVKVLDFGLASLQAPVKEHVSTGTRTFLETQGNRGTLPYMAPEQLLSEKSDARADIYSFGVVLYRIATGRLPFQERLATALVNQILHTTPPDPIQVNPSITPRLQEIILRCLEKNAALRYQTAADLRADLERLKTHTLSGRLLVAPGDVGRAAHRRRRHAVVALAIGIPVVGLLVGMSVYRWLRDSQVGPAPLQRQLTYVGRVDLSAISPDGTSCAYVDYSQSGRPRVMVQDIDQGQPLEVFRPDVCVDLRWSPNGSSLLCVGILDNVTGAFVVPRLGGSVRGFPIPGRSAAWSPDGRRFVVASSSMNRLAFTDASTGDTTCVGLGRSMPRVHDVDWSPRGDRLVLGCADDRNRESLWIMRRDGTSLRRILGDETLIYSPRWSPSSDEVYFLRANGPAMDLCKMRIRGRGRALEATVLAGIQPGSSLSISKDGHRMTYARWLGPSNLWMYTKDAAHTAPTRTQLTEGTGFHEEPKISPDAKLIAFTRGDTRAANIFLQPVVGEPARQLTFMDALNYSPAWSPDGKQIAFGSNQGGSDGIWIVAAAGGPPKSLARTPIDGGPTFSIAWSPGRYLAYPSPGNRSFTILDPLQGRAIASIPADGGGFVFAPHWAPGGKTLAFRWTKVTNEGLWVASLGERATLRPVVPGSSTPLGWSSDARWIYTREGDGERDSVVAVSLQGDRRRLVMSLPFGRQNRSPTITQEGTTVVSSVASLETDVWLIENFDRTLRR